MVLHDDDDTVVLLLQVLEAGVATADVALQLRRSLVC